MKPIIMNSEEIVAIRAGRKTQVRRVVKPQPYWQEMGFGGRGWYWQGLKVPDEVIAKNPYGSKLWVREIWRCCGASSNPSMVDIEYKASRYEPESLKVDQATRKRMMPFGDKWHSPISMPKWMSRIMLEITNVRIEQLQDLTAEDILGEGIKEPDWLSNIDSWHDPDDVMIEIYAEYWDKYYPKYPWKLNPWTFVISLSLINY